MLCTNCSTEIKPIVAIDIDGTLGDYHGHFALFAWQYHFRPVISGHWDGTGDFEDWLGLTRSEYREAKLAYRQGGGKRLMPVYTGSRGLLMECIVAGAEVWLTTTRPWMRHDSTDPDTRSWLERNQLPYHHLLYDDQKYPRLDDLVDGQRVCMVLDDLAEQWDVAEECFPGRVWLRENHHNRADRCVRPQSVVSLAQAAAVAVRQIENWYKENHD